MKIIGITQRTLTITNSGERRDSLDIAWYALFAKLNCTLHILPNHLELLENTLTNTNFDGFLLSGGDDVTSNNLLSQNRDTCETLILTYAVEKKLPVVGVCRGLQFINHFFGGSLMSCEPQISKCQPLEWQVESRLVPDLHKISHANAYHNFAVEHLGNELIALGFYKGLVKVIEHKDLPILGVMWHPERYVPFRQIDISTFQKVLNL